MKLVTFPNRLSDLPLPFWLAAEEWVARSLPPDNYIFAWQVSPTVIIGRNQQLDVEVDIEYCHTHGIEICRRRSGGGAVFADHSNVMISQILPSNEVSATFASSIRRLADMLNHLGVEAEATGRNDITIGGRKVSGGAYYSLPGRAIVHSTMLYDTDMEHMIKAITPTSAKLHSKGVKSVASRITTLKAEGMTITLPQFIEQAMGILTDGSVTVSDSDIEEIEKIALRYSDPDFIAGRRRISPSSVTRRIEGVGQLTFDYTTDESGRIDDISLSGDYFPLGDVDRGLLSNLRGRTLQRRDIADAISTIRTSDVISGLRPDDILDTLTPNDQD